MLFRSGRAQRRNSAIPACFQIVCSLAGASDPAGQFTVTVRDLANNPLHGASVVVDLSGCTDIAICSDQLDLGAIVNCASKTVRKFTCINGQVQFGILGGSNGSGNATTLLGGAKIYANGTLIASPTAAVFDLDGSNGVGINDLSVWLTEFGNGTSAASCGTGNGCPNVEQVRTGDASLGPRPVSCP